MTNNTSTPLCDMTNESIIDLISELRRLKWMVMCEMRGLVLSDAAARAADTIVSLQNSHANLTTALKNARDRIHELQGHTITPELDAALRPFEGE